MADDNKTKDEDISKMFIFSTSATCEFFRCSRETLSNWADQGAPKVSRGKWNIRELMEWRYGGNGGKDSPEVRKLKAEADLKETRAAQERIKLGVTRTEFIPASEVKNDLVRLLANLKKSLLAISHNVASNLGGISPEAAEVAKTEIDKRVADALRELSEGEVYDGKKSRFRRSTRGRK